MPIQTAYHAGEFSDLMGGDVNFEKREYSVSVMENMYPLKQGPAVTRGGTVYVSPVKDSSKKSFIRAFEFSDKTAYILEFGDLYIRFYKNREQIQSGMSAYEVVSPYPQADLFDADGICLLQFSQSADVLYIAHPRYAPRSLIRTSDTSWTITTLTLDDGPYLPLNGTATTLTLSGVSGSVNVTASSTTGINNNTGFQTTDVGRLIRWRDPANNWTWLTITARTSATVVVATVSGSNASATTATVNWRLGAFSATTGYPRAVGFFQDRIGLAGVSSYPDYWALSKTSGYSPTLITFQPTNAAGVVADDNAIDGFIPSGAVNAIQAIMSDARGFVMLTSKEEFLLRASSFGEAITPSNARVEFFSAVGSAPIQPQRTQRGLTFVQDARRSVYDVQYSIEQDNLTPIDITLAAEHITRTRILEAAYQKEPVNIIWFVLGNGKLIGIMHYPNEGRYAWHKHIIGGVSDVGGSDAIVESIACIPSPDGEVYELWLIVKRYIDGATVRYIEYMRKYYEDDMTLETDWAFCDSAVVYDGVLTNAVSGLDHLEGEDVRVMVDGKSHPNLTVTGGAVTLANNVEGEKIQVGLPIVWRLVTRELEQKTRDSDTAQGKNKTVSDLVIRFLNTLGFKYGIKDNATTEYNFNQTFVYDEKTPLFSGDTESLVMPFGSSTNVQMEFKGDTVFPACIVAHMYKMKVSP